MDAGIQRPRMANLLFPDTSGNIRVLLAQSACRPWTLDSGIHAGMTANKKPTRVRGASGLSDIGGAGIESPSEMPYLAPAET